MSARRREMKKSVETNQKRLPAMKHVPWSTGREIKRRKRKRDPQTHQIPDDIVEEIMSKLPVTSLMRFQTVSKQWRSLTRSNGFGEKYMAHHKSKDPKLLSICDDLVNRSKNTLYTKTMTLDTTMATAASQGEDLVWSQKFKRFTGFLDISESCDGLVCIYDMTIRVKLMNPASGMSISLPLARIQRLHIEHPDPSQQLVVADPSRGPFRFRTFTQFGFGKDTVTGRYKLVWLYNEYPATSTSSTTLCEVLDLEDKKWRFVDTSTTLLDHHVLNGQRPAFANGSFYWLTGDEEGFPTTQTKLIVFDIHAEVFQVIPTPPCVNVDACGDKIGVCNLDGRLCISELKGDCKQDFWWMVEDDKTWDKVFSVDLHSISTWFGGITSIPLTPLVICKDSNKVVLSLTYQDNLVSFDLDPHSPVYHLCSSGYYGLAVPYYPSLLLC